MDRLDVAAPPSAQRAGCTKQSECIRLLQNEREDRSGAGATEGGRILVTSATTTTNLPVHQLGVAFDELADAISTDACLLRKEVIQPHLPVRLPCYDFTPITNPTFDGSLPCGLGHRLRVLPTFVV